VKQDVKITWQIWKHEKCKSIAEYHRQDYNNQVKEASGLRLLAFQSHKPLISGPNPLFAIIV
jgi:hypothetical protein